MYVRKSIHTEKGGLKVEDMVRTESASYEPRDDTRAAAMGRKLGDFIFNRGVNRKPGMLAAILKWLGEMILKRAGDKHQQELFKEIARVRKDKSCDPVTKAKMIESLEKGILGIEELKTLKPEDMGMKKMVNLPENARDGEAATLNEVTAMQTQSQAFLQQNFERMHAELLSNKNLTEADIDSIGKVKERFDTAKGEVATLQDKMNSLDVYGRKAATGQISAKLDVMTGAKDSLTEIAKSLKVRLDKSQKV